MKWSVRVFVVGGREWSGAEVAALGESFKAESEPLGGLQQALRRAGFYALDLWARGSTLHAQVEPVHPVRTRTSPLGERDL